MVWNILRSVSKSREHPFLPLFFHGEQKGNQSRIALLIVELVESLCHHAFAFATELLEPIVVNARTDLWIEAQLVYPA